MTAFSSKQLSFIKKYDPSGQIELARGISIYAHTGQFRSDKSPYFTHPERIALAILDLAVTASELVFYDEIYKSHLMNLFVGAVAVGYLHDTIEDNPEITSEYLISKKVDRSIVSNTSLLTKSKEDYYFSYLDRILRLSTTEILVPVLVKIHDIQDNLQGLEESKKASKQKIEKYLLALYTLAADVKFKADLFLGPLDSGTYIAKLIDEISTNLLRRYYKNY